MMFIKMILLSIKRRKKEMRFVSIVTLIAVLFLASTSLFQNVMNRYVVETNYKNYGEWLVSSVNKELEHPYFSTWGSCDTGAAILNYMDIPTTESIGSVDEGFLTLANLEFYEGRLPEKADEIVMDLTALAKLNYNLELGQSIHIRVQVEEEILERDFTLVGTIHDFSNAWNSSQPLPSCLVTAEAVADLGGALYTTHFYQLDRMYEDINLPEMVDALRTDKLNEGAMVTFNSYAYGTTVWGSPESFVAIQKILLLITVLMLSYLMISYISKRRSRYYQLRCTGAGKLQIWAMIFIEGLYGTLPWVVVGFLLPYVLAIPLCAMTSEKESLPNLYVIEGQELLSQILTVAGIILFVLCVACLGTSDKRLSNNVSEVTKGQLRRLKRASKRKKNVAKTFWKRQDLRHPIQKVAMAICSILVSTILVSCIHVTIWKYQEYRDMTERRSDFETWSYTMKEETFVYYKDGQEYIEEESNRYSQIDAGITEQMEKELSVIEGIKSIEMEIQEGESFLDWEGKENSHIYLFNCALTEEYNRDFLTTEDRDHYAERKYGHTSFFIDIYEDLLKNHGEIFALAEIDEEAFRKGEEILVVLVEGYETSFMNKLGEITEGILLKEMTLEDGATVTWKNYDTDVEIQAKARVIYVPYNKYEGVGNQYTVFASMGFAERIAEAKGTQAQYNQLHISLEPNTSFTSTTKRLSALLKAYGFDYEIFWEQKQMLWDEFINSLCIYGTVFCMVLSIYLVLLLNINQMKNFDRSKQHRLLKRLGMSDKFFIQMNVKQGIKEALWLFSGVLFGYIIYAIVEQKEMFNEYGPVEFYSSFTGEDTTEPFWWVMENLLENREPIHLASTIGCMVVLILLVGIIVRNSARKSLTDDEMNEQNLRFNKI